MSLDMGGHIDGTFISVPATRTTYTGGAYVQGVWVPGAGVQSVHVCNIQPMSSKEIDHLNDGGERIIDPRKIYINDGTVGIIDPSDTWEFDGVDGTFKTISSDSRPWRTYAKIVVSRIDDA